jgi:anti-sigma factor RsiW
VTITDPFEHDDAAHVLDVLSEPERETFEAHLATCTACTTRVNNLAATSTLLAAISTDDLAGPDPQPDTLLAGLLRRTASARRRQRWLVSGLGGLAAACLIALAVAGWPTNHPHQRHRAPARPDQQHPDNPSQRHPDPAAHEVSSSAVMATVS